jgi:hypothetical protein
MKVHFTSTLEAREISEGVWQLLAPLRWTVDCDGTITNHEAPIGFETDFCSVPLFKRIANKAGVAHDYEYKISNRPRMWCDELLRAAVIACGYSEEVAESFYLAVRLFGRSYYGWVPDIPDKRDQVYKLTRPIHTPAFIDLRGLCPPIYDQGLLGSCTANAISAAIYFDRMKQKLVPDFIPSRLFIYYNERSIEGTIESDAGAMIRDGIKSVATQGVCPEGAVEGFVGWNYTPEDFKVKPPPICYRQALKYLTVDYSRVPQNRNSMRQCLASGYPFIFGFSVYPSFEGEEVARTGILGMPGSNEAQLGGHAVLAVGYDDSKEVLIVRNSWGLEWGDNGHFTIPYDYLEDVNLAADLWTIRLVV